MTAFEIAQDIDAGCGNGRDTANMFSETRSFGFLDRENGWLKTSVVRLGHGVELWKIVSTGHEVSLNEAGKFSCLIPQAGHLDVATRDAVFRAAAGDILLFSPNERKTRVSPAGRKPYKALAILIPASMTNKDAIVDWSSDRDAIETAVPVSSGFGAGLRDYSAFLESEFDRESSALMHDRGLAAVSTILGEYITDLLKHEAEFETVEATGMANGPGLVGQAEQLMSEHFDQPITIVRLARDAGTSPRLLQLAFQRHRGYSPREALKRIRLAAARKRLSEAGETENVSAIALDCGFTHFGRFSAEYRRTYGVLPSQQLKAARPI